VLVVGFVGGGISTLRGFVKWPLCSDLMEGAGGAEGITQTEGLQ
jgi:hypothetical protein